MKKIDSILLNLALIIGGFAIAEYGGEIMIYQNNDLGILIIIFGCSFSIFGIARARGYIEFIEREFIGNKTKISLVINCPNCNQKCRVPKNRSLEITCPKCSSIWTQMT